MHVFARVSGFGLRLVPIWPYQFQREDDVVTVTHWRDGVAHTATITPGAASPAQADTGAVEDVVEVTPGPGRASWRIETSRYSVEWPSCFDIDPHPGDVSPPFELWGSDEAVIHLWGPYPPERMRPLHAYAAEGQTIVAHVSRPEYELLRLDYQHDGADWRQSYHFVGLPGGTLIVKTQSLAAGAELAERAAEVVAVSARRPDY
jgi:hypothetical protein